jgi:hypothetical protein
MISTGRRIPKILFDFFAPRPLSTAFVSISREGEKDFLTVENCTVYGAIRCPFNALALI